MNNIQITNLDGTPLQGKGKFGIIKQRKREELIFSKGTEAGLSRGYDLIRGERKRIAEELKKKLCFCKSSLTPIKEGDKLCGACIKIDEACKQEGNTMNLIEKLAVELVRRDLWNERCKDYEKDCVNCQLWECFDEVCKQEVTQ